MKTKPEEWAEWAELMKTTPEEAEKSITEFRKMWQQAEKDGSLRVEYLNGKGPLAQPPPLPLPKLPTKS